MERLVFLLLLPNFGRLVNSYIAKTAARRLSTGKTPHIARVAESLHLSPAEAHEYRQQHQAPNLQPSC